MQYNVEQLLWLYVKRQTREKRDEDGEGDGVEMLEEEAEGGGELVEEKRS